MKLVALTIKNILGVSELSFSPEAGNVIEISGGNGKGKTSTLEAIKDVFGASAYSTLIRNGEENGEIVLDFGDIIVNRKHKNEGTPKTTVKAKLPGTDSYGAVGSPAKYIKGLVNASSLDPARLLNAKPKELVDVVLNSMPMQADASRILEITGVNHSTEGHALNVISDIGKTIFEERTGVNREGKQLANTVTSLRETLPEELPSKADLEKQVEQLQEQNLNIHEEFNAERAKVDEEAKAESGHLDKEIEALRKGVDACDERVKTNDALVQSKIDELMRQVDALKEERYNYENEQKDIKVDLFAKITNLGNKKTSIDEERERKQSDIDNRVVAKQQENNQQINQLQNSISQCAVFDNTLSNIKKYEEDLQKIKGKATSMGEQLKMLNEYKAELCESLPIEDLEVKEGSLFLDGVSFETLNTAARLTLVVKLAELNAGDCGLVVLDNTEMMDSETYAQFLAEAEKTDLTFIVARVTDGDLKLTSK